MERIGRYRIIGELGRGAMGVVYHAVDPSIGRSVAIKTIRIRDINETQQRDKLRTRLFREARSAGVLSHPNIVTIYDMDEQEGLAYIAMAFVNGPTLERILGSDQPLSGAVMLRILRQTAAGLDYAHSKGIIHRDIKPANIMTDEDGAVKITDFGIAKLTSGGHTETKTISGTPNYMSPEQVQGQGIDGRTDQFSLAVIAYEILTGERPFVGEALGTVVYKIVAEEPARAHRLNGTLTPQIDSVLRKALSKKADDRYPSCCDFVRALERACAESRGWTTVAANTGALLPTVPALESPVAAKTSPVRSAPVPSAAVSSALETEDLPPRKGSRVPRKASLLIPALMSMLVVSGIAAIVAYQVGWRPLGQTVEIPSPPKENAPAIPAPGEPAATQAAAEPAQAVAQPESENRKPNPIAAAPTTDSASAFEPPTSTRPVAVSSEPAPEAQMPAQRMPAEVVAKPIDSPPAIILPERETPHISHVSRTAVLQDLWVSSNPAGAKAVLDDNFFQACQTPCALKAPAGHHRVMVSLGGFISETREVEVGDNAIDVPAVTLRQPNGSIMVSSNPIGAYLRVDGHLVDQRTPATLSVSPGDHVVSVERNGRIVEKRFAIQAGALKPWSVNLQ